ncbi:hypothetical protein RQP46_000915 [Phenoliferia psychrophenolica]
MDLVQVMSAIEVMDPRTDSFLAHKLGIPDSTTTTRFDASLELLPDELVWILDHLMRLEITHLDGHPLVSTLFTCHYLRPRALRQLSVPSPGTNPSNDAARLPGFRSIVLRAMLLATLKCAEIVWEESCKSQVYEHEDVHLSTAGLSFPDLLAAAFPPPPISPLRVLSPSSSDASKAEPARQVSVDEVLEALDQAQNWLVENMVDSPTREGLLGRIAIRMETVYVVALLSSPTLTNPSQLLVHFSRIRPAIITLKSNPSLLPLPPAPALLAIFAQGAEPPLQSPQPFREIPPIPLGEAWGKWSELLAELENAAMVWKTWRDGFGWPGVREYFVSLSRRETLPYPRSILQSITFSSRTLFATDDLILLVSSFFDTLAGVPPSTWSSLAQIRSTELTWNSPARKVLGWADRVGSNLVGSLTAASQNRARGRRLVVKHRAMTGQLVDELKDILPLLPPLLPPTPSLSLLAPALIALHLIQLLEVLLCGFELALYSRDEWLRVWWVAERLAGLVEDSLAKLRAPGRGYVEARWWEVQVIRRMCRASIAAFSIFPPPPAKKVSPLLSYDDPDALDRARFERTFVWLRTAAGVDDVASWSEFVVATEALRRLEPAQLAQEAQEAYREAVEGLTSLASIPLSARGATVRPEHNVRWIAGLRRTSFASQNALALFPKLGSQVRQVTPTAKWDAPWFPLITAIAIVSLPAWVAADATLTGFAGADCTGSIINEITYPSGAGCHCDWGNSAKSASVTGSSSVTFFATNEPNVCDPAFTLGPDESNACAVAPVGFNLHCAFVH